MTEISRDRWLILAAEGVAIVVSILLAFTIDAWWDERADRNQEAALLVSLRADFEASQAHLERWLAGNRKVETANRDMLDQLRTADRGETVSVQRRLILGVLSSPTYTPTDSTLRAAISSGRIELIQSDELRKELADWDQLLVDTSEDEILIRQIILHRLMPELSAQMRLGFLLDFETIVDFFLGETLTVSEESFDLQVESELEGAVAQRLFHTVFVVQGLADLYESQGRILELIDKNIRKDNE